MAKGQASRRSLRAGRRLQSPELREVRGPWCGYCGTDGRRRLVRLRRPSFRRDRKWPGWPGPADRSSRRDLLERSHLPCAANDRPARSPSVRAAFEPCRSATLARDPRHRDRGRSRAGQFERIVAGRLLQWDVFSLAPPVRSVAVRRCVQSSARPRHNGRHLARARGRRFGDSRVGRRAREPTGGADSTGRSRARRDPPPASGAPAKSPPQPGPRRLRRHVRRQRRLGRLWWREP